MGKHFDFISPEILIGKIITDVLFRALLEAVGRVIQNLLACAVVT